jgi:dTMP kinase
VVTEPEAGQAARAGGAAESAGPALAGGAAGHGAPGGLASLATLVSFAGLDGAGKTTQARLLAGWLADAGQDVALEAPEGPSFIRSVLTELAGEQGLADHHDVFGPDVTHLLTAFMRYRDWAERVLPAMRTRQWVITDRSAVCHYAAAYAVGAANLDTLRLVMDRLPRPGLTVYLDVTPAEAFARLARRQAGQEELAFLTANEAGYRRLPEFAGFTVVPGSGSVAEVQARVQQAVRQCFPLPPQEGRSAD